MAEKGRGQCLVGWNKIIVALRSKGTLWNQEFVNCTKWWKHVTFCSCKKEREVITPGKQNPKSCNWYVRKQDNFVKRVYLCYVFFCFLGFLNRSFKNKKRQKLGGCTGLKGAWLLVGKLAITNRGIATYKKAHLHKESLRSCQKIPLATVRTRERVPEVFLHHWKISSLRGQIISLVLDKPSFQIQQIKI